MCVDKVGREITVLFSASDILDKDENVQGWFASLLTSRIAN